MDMDGGGREKRGDEHDNEEVTEKKGTRGRRRKVTPE